MEKINAHNHIYTNFSKRSSKFKFTKQLQQHDYSVRIFKDKKAFKQVTVKSMHMRKKRILLH